MIYHLAKDPDSYQRLFYQQIGLKHRDAKAPQNDWSDDEIGSIYTYGTMDTIQFGIGDYTISQDFLAEFQYDTEYLHAGIIYEGITYSLVENQMQQSATPSPFLAIEHACGGINCWRRGQHFKGVEISIEMEYLKNKILPYLGVSDDSLDFLVKNVRHVHLPKELTDLILQIQRLLEARSMTPELLLALGTTFTALLIRPDFKQFFFTGTDVMYARKGRFFCYYLCTQPDTWYRRTKIKSWLPAALPADDLGLRQSDSHDKSSFFIKKHRQNC